LDIGTLNIAATIAVIPAFEQSISSKTRKCKEYILRLFRTLLNAVDGLYQFCLFSFISSPVLSNQNPRMYAGTYGQVLDKKYRILALAYIQYAPLRHDNIGSLPNCTVRLSSCHGTMDDDGRVLVRTLQSLDSEIQ
jgi:hypothetical protein